LLLQLTTPKERLSGIRQELTEGSSPGDVCLVLLGIAAFIGLLFALYTLQRQRQRTQIDDSGKLFRTLLSELQLTVPQRDVLRRIARDLALTEPTVLLLAPQLYWSYAEKWLSRDGPRSNRHRTELKKAATMLFPRTASETAPPT
jgi:hypothetical protein